MFTLKPTYTIWHLLVFCAVLMLSMALIASPTRSTFCRTYVAMYVCSYVCSYVCMLNWNYSHSFWARRFLLSGIIDPPKTQKMLEKNFGSEPPFGLGPPKGQKRQN